MDKRKQSHDELMIDACRVVVEHLMKGELRSGLFTAFHMHHNWLREHGQLKGNWSREHGQLKEKDDE